MQNWIEYNDLSQPVYEKLRKMIETGELSPGQKLIQEKLATELGVSRTPVLKALQNLEHEMYVTSIPRRGMYVKKISTQEMIDVYECREAVECMAVRLIIEKTTDLQIQNLRQIFEPYLNDINIEEEKYRKADEEFHDMIIDLSQNPVLKKMSKVSNIHHRVYQYGLVRSPEETLVEHMRIVDAISNRDKDQAEKEVRNHIGLSKQQIKLNK